MKRVRLFISTGEVSGDLQGAMLVRALWQQAAALGWQLEIAALGGEHMAKAGATLLANTTAIGSVGLLESLPFLIPTLLRQRRARAFLQAQPPDLVVLIDYLGPNLTLGTYLHRQFPQIPVAYFIAPQMWVWTPSLRQVRQLVRITDVLLAIFPEEARFFRQHNAKVVWVGHPLVDRAQDAPTRQVARQQLGIGSEEIAIALFPASRKQELRYLMPVMFQAAQQLQTQISNTRFLIPVSLEAYRAEIEAGVQAFHLNAQILSGVTREVIAAADLAIAKSGTVNLELALANVPQVVLYRVHPLTAAIARRLLGFSIPFMSPPNLMDMQPIVPELLQEQATPANILQECLELLQNPTRKQTMLDGYAQIRRSAGEPGVCDRAAAAILDLLH